MLRYLAEDPWPLAGALGLVALGFLVALWATQQGKYLIWACVVVAVGAVMLTIEHFWVTDNERIERVVYEMARAAEASDADGVLSHLAPKVAVTAGDRTLDEQAITPELIRVALQNTRFDYIRLSRLTTEAGAMTRLGTASFRLTTMGSTMAMGTQYNFAEAGDDWSLGFRETSPGVWKVTRISPPPRARRYLTGRHIW